MSKPVVFCLLVVSAIFITAKCNLGQQRRFEYKYSFKGPHLVQRDGTIPFWEHGGDAIPSSESIRITPSLRSKKGWVWTKEKTTFPEWEIEIAFSVTGRGRIGADGLAIWFTEEKGINGPVFGGFDKWKGLGIFFDSFDNDGQHNNPYILAMVNDGTKMYDHQSDGLQQQIGGCMRDFRNKPFPVRAKIEYYKKALTIYFNSGMVNVPDAFELCMRAENVELPSSGHFGVSAATGGLADDHDVFTVLTHSLQDKELGSAGVSEEERKKFETEFDEYNEKLKKAKEEYQKEHPDKVKDPYAEIDEGQRYEEQGQRELKQVFDGQKAIHSTVRDLHRKLDEVIGRQERTLSQIALMSGTGNIQVQPQGGTGTGQLPVDTIKRNEVDHIINTQAQISQVVQEMKNVVNDVHSKTNAIHSNQGQGKQQGGAGGGQQAYNLELLTHELKDNLNNIRDQVQQLVNRPQGGPAVPCPPPVPMPSCLSSMYFFVFMILQTVIFIGYMMYKSSKEAQAKKFY